MEIGLKFPLLRAELDFICHIRWAEDTELQHEYHLNGHVGKVFLMLCNWLRTDSCPVTLKLPNVSSTGLQWWLLSKLGPGQLRMGLFRHYNLKDKKVAWRFITKSYRKRLCVLHEMADYRQFWLISFFSLLNKLNITFTITTICICLHQVSTLRFVLRLPLRVQILMPFGCFVG